ncbi:hypothetical protein D3C81_1689740 [compost metagenome]
MPFQVHAHHHVPVLFRQADEHAVTQDPGVVDQNMHFVERRQCSIDDALSAAQGGDVAIVGDCSATTGTNFVDHRLGGLATNVIDHHIGAFSGKCQRIRAAQPATGTGDDRGTTCTDSHRMFSCC